jgi:hypothetical protein
MSRTSGVASDNAEAAQQTARETPPQRCVPPSRLQDATLQAGANHGKNFDHQS